MSEILKDLAEWLDERVKRERGAAYENGRNAGEMNARFDASKYVRKRARSLGLSPETRVFLRTLADEIDTGKRSTL